MRKLFIHSVTRWSEEWDLKTLIPDANSRRRMSRLVKMGVATGIKCWDSASLSPDNTAIITSTQYGCLTDSEKFLRNMIEAKETNLSPTPFIQSTFNTIGSQIALLKACKGYNMTYVNRQQSLFDALIDAMMLASEGKDVLLGYLDESTQVLQDVASRMKGIDIFDGALFAVVSATKPDGKAWQLPDIDLKHSLTNRELIDIIERQTI